MILNLSIGPCGKTLKKQLVSLGLRMSECWRFNAMTAMGYGSKTHEYLDMRRQTKAGMLRSEVSRGRAVKLVCCSFL